MIDIQISVNQLHPIDAYSPLLGTLGYVHRPHADDSFFPFFGKPAVWPRTHHVHVVEYGGLEERRTLAFRDYLRDHDGLAREYEKLKMRLASRFKPADLQDYADAKSELIERVIAQALQAGYPRGL